MPKAAAIALAGILSSSALLSHWPHQRLGLVCRPDIVVARSPQITSYASRPCRPGDTDRQPAVAIDLSADERTILADLNRIRAAHGLSLLVIDSACEIAARQHSTEMCHLCYFDHYSPTSGVETPIERYRYALRLCKLQPRGNYIVGENLYRASHEPDDVDLCMRALMASEPHRVNILDPEFDRVGIGAYRDSQGSFWVTQVFLGERAQQYVSQ